MIGLNVFTKLQAGCTTLLKGIGSGLLVGLLFALGYVVYYNLRLMMQIQHY